MRIDFSPYQRSTVGFDRLFSVLDAATQAEAPSYPPYNIERTDENAYRVSMAVASFTEHDLGIEVKENVLTVTGKKAEEEKRAYLHHGIATRSFERRFHLADYMQVSGAKLENGLLHIDLIREIPEAKRARRIQITNEANRNVIEAKSAAAA